MTALQLILMFKREIRKAKAGISAAPDMYTITEDVTGEQKVESENGSINDPSEPATVSRATFTRNVNGVLEEGLVKIELNPSIWD